MTAYEPRTTMRVSTCSLLAVFVCCCSLMSPVEPARILAVETVAGRSHWNFMSSILRVLSENGHHVTVFTPFPDGPRANYTEVDTSKAYRIFLEMNVIDTLKEWQHPTAMVEHARKDGRGYCDIIYGNAQLKKLMDTHDRINFDVIIIESIGRECIQYLATKLKLPMIFSIPSPMPTFAERTFFGHYPNPATISHLYSGHSVPKTFTQRLTNTALLAYSVVVMGVNDWIKKYTESKPYDVASLDKPSLIFVNSHYISEASRPYPPHVIQVGGLHLKPPKKLPADILEFIEKSPNGVILFTFGSTMRMSTLPKHILNAFKDALAQLPQRVLWKYEEEMEDMPKNVMCKKWLPQRDILKHPNVKLFISHGGMSGVYETVDAGVPVLGFPLFFDQPKNIDNLVNAGMAKSMDLLTIKKDTFLRNILELVTDEKYMKNAKIAADRFKDRPMTPQQSILYWTEYIVRHKGAPHLKPHAINQTWYQYFLLDVLAVILILVLVIVFALSKAYKMLNKLILDTVLRNKTKSE